MGNRAKLDECHPGKGRGPWDNDGYVMLLDRRGRGEKVLLRRTTNIKMLSSGDPEYFTFSSITSAWGMPI